VPTEIAARLNESKPNIESLIASGEVCLVINTPTKGRESARDGFKMRRLATESGIPCLTAPDTAAALAEALKLRKTDKDLEVVSLDEVTGNK